MIDLIQKINLHTHTELCKHAVGTVDDYCAAALDQGFSILGISDHGPFPNNQYGGSRMSFSQLGMYRNLIEQAKHKYKGLELFAGAEVDVTPEFGINYLKEVYLGEHHFDYLIGAVHFVPSTDPEESLWGTCHELSLPMARKFMDANIALIESGIFTLIAHPDIFATKCQSWTPDHAAMSRDLIQSAIDHDIFLEINAYGMRKPKAVYEDGERWQYPWRQFWELAAEMGVRMVIGTDAHRPVDLWSNGDEAVAWARSLGLEPQNAAAADRIRKSSGFIL